MTSLPTAPTTPSDPTNEARDRIYARWTHWAGGTERVDDDGERVTRIYTLQPGQIWPGEVPVRMMARLLPVEEVLDIIDKVAFGKRWGAKPQDVSALYARAYEQIRIRYDR